MGQVQLGTGYRLHTDAVDMDWGKAVRRMYGAFNTRNPLYPRSPYANGLGRLSKLRASADCTPTSCAGPYDNPIYNYAYQAQVASQVGYQAPVGSDTQAIPQQYQPYIQQQMDANQPVWDYTAARSMVPYKDPGIPPDSGIVMENQQAANAFNAWWTSTPGNVHYTTEKFVWNGPDPSQLTNFMANQQIGTGRGYSVQSTGLLPSQQPPVTQSQAQSQVVTQAQASAVTGKPNQSVPPRDQAGTVPGSAGFPSTASSFFQSVGGGGGLNVGGTQISGTALAIGAAIVIGFMMFGKKGG
jgi:hypothetical protein